MTMRSSLRQRLLEASPPFGRVPIGAIRACVQRRRQQRRLALALGGAAATVALIAVAGSMIGGDLVQVGTSDGDVKVPDVTGLSVAEAKQALEQVGLKGSVASGSVVRDGRTVPWSDPDDAEALVAAQEPPGGARVPRGSIVGLRTGIASRDLCAVFTEIPPREGDALDLAASPGFFDMLRRARPHASGQLADAIDLLLLHRDAGGSDAAAPAGALDRVTVQHDACARNAAGGSSADERSTSRPEGGTTR